MFEVTVKFIGLYSNPVPTSTQTKHRTFHSQLLWLVYKLLPVTNVPLFFNGELSVSTTLSLLWDTKQLSENYDFTFYEIYDLILCINKFIFAAKYWCNHIWNFIQPDDPRNTQLLATHSDFSKQCSLRHFRLIRVQKWGQALS